MTVHVFTPSASAARDRVTALELAELDRRIEAARREDTLRQIREAIRPRILRARRRQALRRAVDALVSTQGGLLLMALLFALIAAVLRYADQIDGWAR